MLAAIVLVGGTASDIRTLPLAVALSLFYVGGMFLNDAFDAEIDARERPERPIPSGEISREAVFRWGFGMLVVGIALLGWSGLGIPGGTGIWPALSGIGLAAAIIVYNRHHKGNPSSPLIMGLCRVFVYLSAGLSFVASVPNSLMIGAGLLLAYLIGLTYVAKQENLGRVENMWPLLFLGAPIVFGAFQAMEQSSLWPYWGVFTTWVLVALYFVKRRGPGDIPRAVVSLIAGICLLDAVLIANAGEPVLAGVAIVGFVLTLLFQKFVSGT